MSNFIKEVNWKKYYCIDNYFWDHEYWYIEFEEWDTWLSLDIHKRKVLKELPNIKFKEESLHIDKKQYFKQLKENIKLLEEENRNLRKDIDMLNDINNAWTKELMFSNSQKEHYKTLLEEVEVLVNKWINKELIQKVIENWYKRAELDLAIHCDEIFKNNKWLY